MRLISIRRRFSIHAAACLLSCVCCIAMATLFPGCAPNSTIAGTGSQAGNARVACMIYNADGTPASGTAVYLRSRDYTADTSGAAIGNRIAALHDTRTDSMGVFCIDSVDTGSYYIEVNDGKAHAVLLACAVTESDTMVRLPGDTLHPTGSIKGVLASAPNDSAEHYIQIYGLERVGVLDRATGGFVINDIPPGNYSMRVLSSIPEYRPVQLDNAIVASDEATDIGNIDFFHRSRWRYFKRLYLNTSPTGASVAGMVTGFPVLVRLRESNFDFSQANKDGGDVRFTKADGTPLPYETERYDAAARQGDIWVNVDTVHGNDNTQFLTMYWGNPAAAGESDGQAVFDTAAGFAGVWHLGENGDSIADATGNAFSGKNSGSTVATGIIGNSRNFSNGNHIRVPGLLKSPSDVTLSVWVRSDTVIESGQDIVSVGDAVLIRLDDIKRIGTAGCYHNDSIVDDSKYATVSSGRYLAKTGWHHLVFSISTTNSIQTFYIDGIQYGIARDAHPINYEGLGADTYIGMHGNGKTSFNFIGQIDEVRINNRAMPSDWIKLCFVNQKEQDGLLRW